MKREASSDGNTVEERQLFHGVSPEHVNIACKKNLNWRLFGQQCTSFGQGTHFAVDSSLANQSCSDDSELCRFIFLADVLVGSYVKGEPSLPGPPQKCPTDPNSDFYDSCVDDVDNPTVFILFDTDQCYPSFLIRYKLNAYSVCVGQASLLL